MEIDRERFREELTKFVKPHLKGTRYKSLVDKVVSGRVLSAVRCKCLDCTAFQETIIRNCAIESCPLWPYRMGRNPFRKRMKKSTADHLLSQEEQQENKDDEDPTP
jgi:hypothetical protein